MEHLNDPVLLSRLQFALTAMFHIVWPLLTIGLSLFLAAVEALWLKTGDTLSITTHVAPVRCGCGHSVAVAKMRRSYGVWLYSWRRLSGWLQVCILVSYRPC